MIEDEQDIYNQSVSPSASVVAMPSEKADMIDKINPDKTIETTLHRLMGQEFKNGQWLPVPELQNRALTLVGAWDICNLMLSGSNLNVSISKTNDDDIRKRIMSIVKTAMIMCLRNWKEYGIRGSDQIYFVKEIVMNNMFFTMKQSDMGNMQNLIKGTSQEQHVFHDVSGGKGGGMFQNLMRPRN
jgi:hypothetical protein